MMSDGDHNSVYHRKMALLQEKLRKSEEERFKLEEKFSVMMKACKEEEEERLSHLKLQYENFLEEDRKRRDRNDRIMRSLDRIESRAATLNAKSKRLKLLREHYEAYLKRVYPTWKNKGPITTSTRNNHTGNSPIKSFDQHIDSSYAERFTTPFATNRRNSVSFSDNLSSSPRLTDIPYSPRTYDNAMCPSGFARYQQRTLDREVNGGEKSTFPTNIYEKTVVNNGLEYDPSPNSYSRGIKTQYNNIDPLNNSSITVNGFSGFAGRSIVPSSDMFFGTDTQKFPSPYENRMQNLSDSKTEIHGAQDRLQLLHDKNIMGSMEKSASFLNSGKGDLNPMYKKVSIPGMTADVEWEQNTSRDLLNLSLSDDGKVSNGPSKTEQLMKHQQNLHVLKMQDAKTPMTEGSHGGNHNLKKDFCEEDAQKQSKEDLTSDYNKQEEIGALSPHKTYGQESHTETDELNGINSLDNSTDDISIEIGRKIERALSSERETKQPGSPEKQRNLDIIVEETNSTEDNRSHSKSVPEKTYDFSMNDSELLSGAVLTEGDDEMQFSLNNGAGLDDQHQIIPEGTALPETTMPIGGEQIMSNLKSQNEDFSKGECATNIEGNGSEAVQGTYENNIQTGDDSFMYLQEPQNVYETVPAYTEDIRQVVYDDYNNDTVNAQHGEQYMQELPEQEVLAETYDSQATNFDSGLQQMQTGGGDPNESGIIFDNTQDQNYMYDTVQNTQEGYNPGGEASENFYVETYDSSDPNFGQQLQPNNVVPDQRWGPYNEMAFQGDSSQDAVQPAYQNFEIQQDMNTQGLQPGEFMYSEEIASNNTQFLEQGPYYQKQGQDQYFYVNDVHPTDVQTQEDASGYQFDHTTNIALSGQQTYQQPDEGPRIFSPQHNQDLNPAVAKADEGAAIPQSHVLDKNKDSDVHLEQDSEQYTTNQHAVENESFERSGNNSERQLLEEQSARSVESVPITVQDSINLTDHFGAEISRVKGEFYQDPHTVETKLSPSETTNNKTDCGIDIEESSTSKTKVEDIAAKMSSSNEQGDVRHLDVLDTISEEVKDTNSSNSCEEVSKKDQYKDIVSGHKEAVESNMTTKSDERVLNSGNKGEQTKISSNKEPSDLDSAKSIISGEEEFSESFDGGKYHEPTVGYESGIPGYSNAADSSTTEDSSERWTTMPKKTRQQMTLKVQNKKAETTLPPDDDSSDESGQIQPALHGPQASSNPQADTSEDSEQLNNRMTTAAQNKAHLGEQKEPSNTGENTSRPDTKLGRLPARGSTKLPTMSTVLDSDIDSLHLGSESSMT